MRLAAARHIRGSGLYARTSSAQIQPSIANPSCSSIGARWARSLLVIAAQGATARNRRIPLAESGNSGPGARRRPDPGRLLRSQPQLLHQRLGDDVGVPTETLLLELALPVDDAVERGIGKAAPESIAEPAPPVQNGPEDVQGDERD